METWNDLFDSDGATVFFIVCDYKETLSQGLEQQQKFSEFSRELLAQFETLDLRNDTLFVMETPLTRPKTTFLGSDSWLSTYRVSREERQD
jgi:hypothetical protein